VAGVRRVLAERPSPKTGAPLSVSRVNLHLAAIRGVLEECWRLGMMSSEEYRRAADVKGVKGSVLPRGRHLHPGELRDLFRVCAEDKSPAAVRDAALLAIGYGAGLRISEVVSLLAVDFDPEAGEVKVRQGKGRKDRNVYVLDGAAEAIAEWLLIRGAEPGPLFCPVDRWGNLRPGGLTERAVFKRLERRREQAGVKTYSPHDLRRTFAGDLLDAGVDLSTVQDLMGHASPTTTKRYDRRDNRRKREAALRVRVPYIGPRP
jgi:site-specific recombinase XerC